MLAVLGVHACRATSPGAERARRPPEPADAGAKLTEEEAIRRAEEFVVVMGFTDLPGDPREMNPGDPNAREAVRDRHDTLLKKACGLYRQDEFGEAPGWTIVFCHNPRNQGYRAAIPNWDCRARQSGRPVTMDPWGRNLGIIHMDISIGGRGYQALWTPWAGTDAGTCHPS
jgi:hypothetical protein